MWDVCIRLKMLTWLLIWAVVSVSSDPKSIVNNTFYDLSCRNLADGCRSIFNRQFAICCFSHHWFFTFNSFLLILAIEMLIVWLLYFRCAQFKRNIHTWSMEMCENNTNWMIPFNWKMFIMCIVHCEECIVKSPRTFTIQYILILLAFEFFFLLFTFIGDALTHHHCLKRRFFFWKTLSRKQDETLEHAFLI